MDESGEIVTPAIPAFLRSEAFDGRPLNRLDLARWLISPENPLTARTTMNRLWKQFFGSGLSKVLDDLGGQGEPPMNPELLDWLACEFMDSGWNMKHMIRQIVLSDTYQQTSVADAEQIAIDPHNREYGRQSAFRMEAELVRDYALAISGLMVDQIGGPSVKPYQPPKYWENLNFPPREWKNGSGAELYRRGLYTWWQRSFLHPSMLAFDAPSREECVAERNRSNIPQQALVLLNDSTYVEAARAFATRLLAETTSNDQERIRSAFQLALQRTPNANEEKTLIELLEDQRQHYRETPQAALDLAKIGEYQAASEFNPSELAAWTHIARVLLNLHETITRS